MPQGHRFQRGAWFWQCLWSGVKGVSLALLSCVAYFPCKMSTCQAVQDAIRADNNFLPQPERCCFLMGYVQKVMSTLKGIILMFWEKK